MKRQVKLDIKVFRRLFVLVPSLLVLVVSSAQAQTSNITDGTTPLGIAPGAPAGSYPLTDIEVLNVYNGNASLCFPLIKLGGRGAAQHVVTLPIEQRWTVDHTTDLFTGQTHDFPEPTWWYTTGRYSAGRLLARHATSWICADAYGQTLTLTRLTFTAPDGTEYELRDTAADGDRRWSICAYDQPHFNRGRVFKTADGTAATFISDTDVQDSIYSGFVTPMTGHLMLRDGTCYRFDNGDVTWIRDRNGNKISFIYNGAISMTITDSLNRRVFIEYDVTESSPYGLCDRVTFTGFGGASRVIRISKKNLSEALRTTQPGDSASVKTYRQLFPELLDAYANAFDSTDKIASVWLPDGRRYQIFYNVYGEVARVILPTGGALEYDWDGGVQGWTSSGVIWPTEIYRKVITRRTYTDSGLSSLISKTTYSKIALISTSDVTVTNKDANDTVLSGSRHYFYSNAAYSLSGDPLSYPTWKEGKQYQTEALNIDGSVLRRVTNTWQQRAPVGWWTGNPDFAPSNDPRITETVTALTDVNPNLVAKQTLGYDQFNNRTDTWEYDFGQDGPPSFPLRHAQTAYLVNNPVNGIDYTGINLQSPSNSIHLKSLPRDHYVYAVNASTGADIQPPAAQTSFEYDKYDSSANHASLLDRFGISGHDAGFDAARQTRGNVTSTNRWLNTTGAFLSSYSQHDVAGNIVKSIDPLGNAITIDFSDRFGIPDDESRNNAQAPAELGLQTSYAFPTRVTNALGHVAYTQYDYYLGSPINGEDANGVVTKGRYDDALDRPTELVVAENLPSLRRRTLITYIDSAHLITTQSDQTVFQDGALKTEAISDGLGRGFESREYESSSAYITSRKEFDALGRVKRAFNPFRSTSDETYGWTTTSYDALGRISRVEAFDGAGTSTGAIFTTDQGIATTVVDQTGKKHRTVTDALGRLVRVDEPDSTGNLDNPANPSQPLQPTSYVYDVLDDLVKVAQGGQTRFFSFDSLKRLIRVRTPEQDINTNLSPAVTDPVTGNSQWSIKYAYDGNSNLRKRTDSRNITTTYNYDAFNRVISRIYPNDPQNTPAVAYTYDAQPLPTGSPTGFDRGYSTGRLVAVTYGGASAGNYMSYNQLGRVASSKQQTDGQNYGFTYGYNIAGEMTSEGYPSGRTITVSYDLAGRLASVNGQKSGVPNTAYASSFSYGAQGAMTSVTLGNHLIEKTTFNSRMQPTVIKVGTTGNSAGVLKLDYTYGVLVHGTLDTTKDNGNIQSQTVTVGASAIKQTYLYDSLNRLESAAEQFNQTAKWTQSYAYDRYANRTSLSNSGVDGSFLPTSSTPPIDTATNRINQSDFGYDAAGNLIQEPGKVYDYDAENRQTKFNNGAVTYSYDGNGNRVKKVVPGNPTTTTLFVYNAAGQLIAEYTDTTPSSSGGTNYLTSDQLGSTRVVTNGNGGVVSRRDYLPYGEEISSQVAGRSGIGGYGVSDGLRQRFTQNERDSESGLDYFLARHYSSATGRFTSPDPKLDSGTPVHPQGWNRYSYVINNPLRYTDPTGLDWWYLPGQTMGPVWFDHDPGGRWKRWSDRFGYVYRVNSGRYAGAWVALDPFSGRAYVSADQAGALTRFQAFVSGRFGLISGTQADREFLAGFAEGISPLGPVAGWLHGKVGIDTDSRDYKGGFFIGALVAAGVSITAETVAAIRATGMIDPNKIRFSHDDISPNFKDLTPVAGLTEGLRSGDIIPAKVDPIRVVVKDGQLFTLDNRRLWAYQQAGVDIPVRMATRQEAAREGWKFTTKNGGTSVRVRK